MKMGHHSTVPPQGRSDSHKKTERSVVVLSLQAMRMSLELVTMSYLTFEHIWLVDWYAGAIQMCKYILKVI